jgi:hypothetical protein
MNRKLRTIAEAHTKWDDAAIVPQQVIAVARGSWQFLRPKLGLDLLNAGQAPLQ